MTSAERRRKILEEAWIGDAVLCLHARRMILGATGAVDGELLQSMTSNRFLTRFGDASEVEAEIGRIYQRQGLDAAFAWIDQTMGKAWAKALEAGTSHPRK